MTGDDGDDLSDDDFDALCAELDAEPEPERIRFHPEPGMDAWLTEHVGHQIVGKIVNGVMTMTCETCPDADDFVLIQRDE